MLLHNEKSRVHILGTVKKREVGKVKAIEERERETDRKKNGKEEKFIAHIQCHIQATTNSLWYYYYKKI